MRAVYDLQVCPPTYDVIAFLSLLHLERKRRGFATVNIHILPGPIGGFRRDGLWPQNTVTRVHLRDSVLVPICQMLPETDQVTVETQRGGFAGEYGHNQRLISLPLYVKALQQGSRPLRVPDQWKLGPKDPKLITMTLREAEHWPIRNSRTYAWARAANALVDRGYRVVIIRDTIKADELLITNLELKAEIDSLSACYINVRTAMYERALVNIGINNGPMWLAIAMNAPVLMLRPVTDAAGGCYDTHFFKSCGIDKGQQLPTSPPWQRLVWQDDTADNIIQAFDEMLPCLSTG